MKLISASTVEQIDSFLHAGYISAYPRPLAAEAYPPGSEYSAATIAQQLDIVEALKLEGGTSNANANGLDAVAALMTTNIGHAIVTGALTVTGVLLLLYLFRLYRFQSSPTPWQLASSIVMASMLIFIIQCNDSGADALPTDPPWEEVSRENYLHRDQATLAILHGVVAPALANIGQKVEMLANLRDEVALPVKHLSEGAAYALKTYGLDGYGKQMKFETHAKADEDEERYWAYIVTSAGADGAFDTDDDIALRVDQTINDSWDYSPQHPFYLVKYGDNVSVLIHRWNNKMFEYREQEYAEEITGSNNFDVVGLRTPQLAAAEQAFVTESEKVDHVPLVIQVFETNI